MSPQEMLSIFLNHNSVHKSQEKIFTDGSKSRGGVGCALLYKQNSYQARLSNKASVFTAEMTAIIESLKVINQSNKETFVIYSDSYSAVSALDQYNSFHPLVQKAQEWLFRLHIKFKKIHFCWIPSHVGIHQNEVVDQEAKEAVKLPSININFIPTIDMKGPIKQYILCKWHRQWNSPQLLTNLKYRNIRSSVETWSSSFQPPQMPSPCRGWGA